MTASNSLSKAACALLKDAHSNIRQLVYGKHYLLYEYIRRVISKITKVDSFYVGYYCEGGQMIFPYAFDGEEYDDPEPVPYQEDGLSAWMLSHKSPYMYMHDKGLLLARGQRFGDVSRLSQDVVAVPLLERLSRKEVEVKGIMAVLSYTPGVYDETTVQALVWLAESMMTEMQRKRYDQQRLSLFELEDKQDSLMQRPVSSMIEGISWQLKSLRKKIETVQLLASHGSDELRAAVNNLKVECEQSQTEIYELMHRTLLGPDAAILTLTRREKEVLSLLVEDLSNKEIATRLTITEPTVKNHVSSILLKFGVTGRTAVIERLKRTL